MKCTIYVEGGGDSNDLKTRCREGFRRLLKRCNFQGRMPRLVACGSRNAAFDNFKTALKNAADDDFVALWIDSEEPLSDLEAAWQHLKIRDGWEHPQGTSDDQVLFMTTCMETWIIADRTTLAKYYESNLQESALPSLHDLELKSRSEIQEALYHATQSCANAYSKGKRSFTVLGLLNPVTLRKNLPSFARILRILNTKLAS